MTINFTARHFEASQQLKDYAFEAVNKLPQYFDRIVSCTIVLAPTFNKRSTKSRNTYKNSKQDIKSRRAIKKI